MRSSMLALTASSVVHGAMADAHLEASNSMFLALQRDNLREGTISQQEFDRWEKFVQATRPLPIELRIASVISDLRMAVIHEMINYLLLLGGAMVFGFIIFATLKK